MSRKPGFSASPKAGKPKGNSCLLTFYRLTESLSRRLMEYPCGYLDTWSYQCQKVPFFYYPCGYTPFMTLLPGIESEQIQKQIKQHQGQ